MAKQTHSRTTRPSGREFLLAGIGAVSLARKQARKAYRTLVTEGSDIGDSLGARREHVRRQVEQRVAGARAAVAPMARQARSRLDQAATRIEARVQPLLQRIGLVAAAQKPTRAKAKPAAAKPAKAKTAKAGQRPAAATPARKPAQRPRRKAA